MSNSFSKRFFGKSARERKQRKRFVGQLGSWIFVGAVVLFVVLLLGQLLNHYWLNPPISSTQERTDLLVRPGESIQLTVLNGSGKNNLARIFTDYLRARKFDVVQMGNYKISNVEHSFVIDQVNDRRASAKVAYALGIDASRIVTQVDSTAFDDATVVIGTDYQTLKPMEH